MTQGLIQECLLEGGLWRGLMLSWSKEDPAGKVPATPNQLRLGITSTRRLLGQIDHTLRQHLVAVFVAAQLVDDRPLSPRAGEVGEAEIAPVIRAPPTSEPLSRCACSRRHSPRIVRGAGRFTLGKVANEIVRANRSHGKHRPSFVSRMRTGTPPASYPRPTESEARLGVTSTR